MVNSFACMANPIFVLDRDGNKGMAVTNKVINVAEVKV